MLDIKCKELYRLPITINLIEDFYKLGEASGRRKAMLDNICNIKDLPDELKIKWMVQYNKEWFESISSILVSLREKAKLQDEPHLFTYDLSRNELIILDLLKSEYDKMCKEHCYLVKVNY